MEKRRFALSKAIQRPLSEHVGQSLRLKFQRKPLRKHFNIEATLASLKLTTLPSLPRTLKPSSNYFICGFFYPSIIRHSGLIRWRQNKPERAAFALYALHANFPMHRFNQLLAYV